MIHEEIFRLSSYFKVPTSETSPVPVISNRVDAVLRRLLAAAWIQECPKEVRERPASVLGAIEAERLMVAPDCGLGMLDRATVGAKLRNRTAAAAALA